MSKVAPKSPLLRLPRELRDSIFEHALPDARTFPDDWNWIDTSNKDALFEKLPGLCRVNRQLFQEATPILLDGCYITSWNTETSKHLLKFYAKIQDEEATNCVKEFGMFSWTEEGNAVQQELISKFMNLETLDVTFNFPGIVDGTAIEKYDYVNEQHYWRKTGLHYDPPENRSVEEEKAILEKDTEAFVTSYGLNRIIEMPKLTDLTFQFGIIGSGELYRHRLCNSLWRWATKKMKAKWDDEDAFLVSTHFAEDYDRINMAGS